MKKLLVLLLIFSLTMSLVSCAIFPVYDAIKLISILKSHGYEILENIDSEVQDGMTGYIHAYNSDTKDEIYYMYFKNFNSANSMYNYINNKQKSKISELKMKINKLENLLYKSEGISAAEKGDYYEQYILNKEALEEAENYECGHGVNVVWYGTKKAVRDIRKGE